MSTWLKELFDVEWPVIGMAHIPALPGTPRYNMDKGIEYLIEHVREDVEFLYKGGINAVLFCNEDDRPYVLKAGIEQIAAFTRVVTEVAPKNIPFGIDFLWDPMASIAIAHAVGGSFVREVFTGVYESDMGLWSPNAGEVIRFRHNIGGDNIRVFNNVVPEFSSSLGSRTNAQRARSVVVSCLADTILISGAMAGEEPDISVLEEVKAVVSDTPVFLNTGAKHENITKFLPVVDGVIVGSSFKIDGITWNKVDPIRVKSFMELVKQCVDD